MDKRKPEEIVAEMLRKAGTPDPNILTPSSMQNNYPDEIQILSMAVQNLEHGFLQLALGQEQLGVVIDTARLTLQMILNIMIEKNIISKEEATERYKRDVAEEIMRRQQAAKEEMMKQVEQAKADAAQAEKEAMDKVKEAVEEVTESNVVLPSEKVGKVIRFPSRKEE